MKPADFDTLKKGDRVIVWDPTADALHTECTVMDKPRGKALRVDINGRDIQQFIPRNVPRFVFLADDPDELRGMQLSIVDQHIDYHHRMLVLRENTLRGQIADECMRTEALVHSFVLRELRALRDRMSIERQSLDKAARR